MKNKLLLLLSLLIPCAYLVAMESEHKLTRSLQASGLSDTDINQLEKSIDDLYMTRTRASMMRRTCKFVAVGCCGALMGPLVSSTMHHRLSLPYNPQWAADESCAGALLASFLYSQYVKAEQEDEAVRNRAKLRSLLKSALHKQE